jgi:predicted kinase
MHHFYEETPDRDLFLSRLGRCVSMIEAVTSSIVRHGGEVVLDFGFWSLADRVSTRARFEALGCPVTVVTFAVGLEEQLDRLARRQAQAGAPGQEPHYTFDRATVESLNGLFEEPTADEPTLTQEAFLERLT